MTFSFLNSVEVIQNCGISFLEHIQINVGRIVLELQTGQFNSEGDKA